MPELCKHGKWKDWLLLNNPTPLVKFIKLKFCIKLNAFVLSVSVVIW